MSAAHRTSAVSLTQFSHGGGCGCKIAPALLRRILAQCGSGFLPPQLLVGSATSDDAAVYQLNAEQALVATTDFFTPIVDDASDFGAIAATNALSDVYAMGGKPIMALAIVGMPIAKLSPTTIGQVLQGGAAVCERAQVALAGGHSIDLLEPVYGLVALGLVHPRKVRRNADARAGDVLILGKPLGIGILAAALKKGGLDATGYDALRRLATQLNSVGPLLAEFDAVHAMTDVTGFGLAGHVLEICQGSQLDAQLQLTQLPRMALAQTLAQAGVATGASERNWHSYGADVLWRGAPPEPWHQTLITDPQTSGGLLVSCAPHAAHAVLHCFHSHGFTQAAQIGSLHTPSSARPSVVCYHDGGKEYDYTA